MKKKIIHQSIRTVNFLSKSWQELFNNHPINIMEGYTHYHHKLSKKVTNKSLSNEAYGAAAVYCYYSTLLATHKLFMSYLLEEQEDLMIAFKKIFMQTANGVYLFTLTQVKRLASQIGPGDCTINLLSQMTLPETPTRATADEEGKHNNAATVHDGIAPTQAPDPQLGQQHQTHKRYSKYAHILPPT